MLHEVVAKFLYTAGPAQVLPGARAATAYVNLCAAGDLTQHLPLRLCAPMLDSFCLRFHSSFFCDQAISGHRQRVWRQHDAHAPQFQARVARC